MVLADKPRILVLSSVFPFPRNAGQQQRVYYTLKALRERFHITFLSFSAEKDLAEIKGKLLEQCDDVILLPSLYAKDHLSKLWHRLLGLGFMWSSGLKFSNYLIGELEFSPSRLVTVLGSKKFDRVLFEYWHAAKAVPLFRKMGMASVLDMHDILWQSYAHQLAAKPYFPAWLKQRLTKMYKAKEEQAWKSFDALIAINRAELEYVRQVVNGNNAPRLFYVPMGTDLTAWTYCWQPASPPRIAFYGGLGSTHNQQDALICYQKIMPYIWQKYPNVEFWIVGSNPPNHIQALQADNRVRVTGFVEHVQDVLCTMSLVLCPWSGTYGFRSRVVEVMALGVPVMASVDAVHGMGFELQKGIFVGKTPSEMATISLNLLNKNGLLREQSLLAREQVKERFSYEATYGQFSCDLINYLKESKLSALD